MCDLWEVRNIKTGICLGLFSDYSMAEGFVDYQSMLGNECEVVLSC